MNKHCQRLRSHELLISAEEEHVYEEADFKEQKARKQNHGYHNTNMINQPSTMKPNLLDAASYQKSPEQLKLYKLNQVSDSKKLEHQRKVRNNLLMNNNPGDVKVSMGDKSSSASGTSSIRSIPIENNCIREHRDVSHNHLNRRSKGSSDCYNCLFFLLYVLIAGCLAYMLIHVNYPQILDPEYQNKQLKIDSIKKEYTTLRRFLKAYCMDYMLSHNNLSRESKNKCSSINRNKSKNTTDFYDMCYKRFVEDKENKKADE